MTLRSSALASYDDFYYKVDCFEFGGTLRQINQAIVSKPQNMTTVYSCGRVRIMYIFVVWSEACLCSLGCSVPMKIRIENENWHKSNKQQVHLWIVNSSLPPLKMSHPTRKFNPFFLVYIVFILIDITSQLNTTMTNIVSTWCAPFPPLREEQKQTKIRRRRTENCLHFYSQHSSKFAFQLDFIKAQHFSHEKKTISNNWLYRLEYSSLLFDVQSVFYLCIFLFACTWSSIEGKLSV